MLESRLFAILVIKGAWLYGCRFAACEGESFESWRWDRPMTSRYRSYAKLRLAEVLVLFLRHEHNDCR